MRTIRNVCVGPIRSVREVKRFGAAGAREWMVLPDLHPIYGRGLPVTSELIETLSTLAEGESIGWIISPDTDQKVTEDLLIRSSIDFVDLDYRLFDRAVVKEFASMGSIEVRLSGFWLDYDEDPNWLSERISEFMAYGIDEFGVSVLPSLKRPFWWLKNEAGGFAEDVNVADFRSICEKFPVRINARWSSAQARGWFLEQLPVDQTIGIYLGRDKGAGRSPFLVGSESALGALREM